MVYKSPKRMSLVAFSSKSLFR